FVTKTTRNASGLHKLVLVQVSGWKERLNYPLGVIADTACVNTFADGPKPGNCGILPSTVTAARIVLSVIGNVVTPDTPLGAFHAPDDYVFGSVEIDGVRVGIIGGDLSSVVCVQAP